MERTRIAVVGSGISGLSAAYELQKTGAEVIVLERDDMPGGRMGDTLMGSLRVVTGATVLFSFYADMLELIRDVGIEDRIEPMAYGEASTVASADGEYFINASTSALQLLRTPALSWRSKLRLPLLLPDIWRARKRTNPNLAHTAAHLDDESLADYLSRKVGRDFLENYIEPFFRANWNWEPEDISKAYFLSLLPHIGGHLEVFTFKNGVGLLTRTLAARLDVRLGATVEQIRPQSDGKGRAVGYRDAQGEKQLDVDFVVVAVQGNRVANLVADLSPEEKEFFAAIRYTPVGVVHYVLDRPPEPFERFYARSHPSPFAIYGASRGDPSKPDEPPSLYCELTPQRVAEYQRQRPEKSLDAFVRPLAREMYPELDAHVTEAHEQWWDEMLPAFYPGYIRKMARFLEAHEASKREVVYCGDYLSHAHTGGACASGRRAARNLIAHWRLGAATR
jgi:oxygen-dependent protoporphyrinogen oxidase